MSGAVFVSRAVADDVEVLAALAARCFSRPWTAAQIRDEIALGPPNRVLVARGVEPGGREALPRAFAACRLVLDELHVLDVAVHPDWRRRGLARFLLGLQLRRGVAGGARVALLEVRAGNQAALALYAGLGFRPVGRRRAYYRDPVEDALLLERAGLQPRC